MQVDFMTRTTCFNVIKWCDLFTHKLNTNISSQQINELQLKQESQDESDDGYGGANMRMSSCDNSLSQFKDEPLSELPPEEESEEDTPLVI